MMIQVPLTARLEGKPQPRGGLPFVVLAVLLLPFVSRGKRTTKILQRLTLLAFLCVGVVLAATLTGCGKGSGGGSGSQTQTFTATVTAASGALSHSTNLTIIVP
jgi:hypothetical protein